jgi:hypothetical protein
LQYGFIEDALCLYGKRRRGTIRKGKMCSVEYSSCIHNSLLVHKIDLCLQEYAECCRPNKNGGRELCVAW